MVETINEHIKISAKDEDGYVLLEALFAILILSVGIVVALQAMNSSLRATQYREHYLIPAQQLAEKIMTSIELNTFVGMPEPLGTMDGTIDRFQYKISRVEWPYNVNLRKITVSIAWNDRGKPGYFKLTTVLPKSQITPDIRRSLRSE